MYALLGTCRQITVGPSSAVAATSAAAVGPFAARNPSQFAADSAVLAIMVGIILVLAGIARLGFISDFFARPILTGFVAGLALVIGIGQVPKLFGIEPVSGNFFQKLWGILGELGATNGRTLAVGLGAIVAITILHRVAPRAPAALIAVVLGIAAVAAFNLEAKGVEVVGTIPRWASQPWLARSLTVEGGRFRTGRRGARARGVLRVDRGRALVFGA